MDISLALGGGGSKGIAHIGVLACLEESGYQIKAIAGTSAGGIVAAIYAAGFSPHEMLTRFLQVDQSALYRHQPGEWPALLGVAGLNKVLQEMLGDCRFEDLRIPCALTAVDIEREEEVILQKGRVVDAILATVAIPGIFPPQLWENRYLVDGGLLDPVPVLPARALAPNLPVVAVVLSSLESRQINILEPPPFLGDSPILRQVARLPVARAFRVFFQSVQISSRHMAIMRLEMDRPEVIIQPDLADVGILDKVDITEIAQRGELAARQALPSMHKAFSWPMRLRRYLNQAKRLNLS